MTADDQTAAPVVNRNKLREIANSTIPNERLEFESETILMQVADEFVDDLLTNACRLAKHRDSTTLEASDLLLYLERDHDITVPGYENLEDKVAKRSGGGHPQAMGTDEHARRLAQVQRASNSMAHSSSQLGMQGLFPSTTGSSQFPGQSPFFPGHRR